MRVRSVARLITTRAIGPSCVDSSRCACSIQASDTGALLAMPVDIPVDGTDEVSDDAPKMLIGPTLVVAPLRDPPVPVPVPPGRVARPRKVSRAVSLVICSASRACSCGRSRHSRAARRTSTAASGPTWRAKLASTCASTAGSQFVGIDVLVLVLVGAPPSVGSGLMRSVGA